MNGAAAKKKKPADYRPQGPGGDPNAGFVRLPGPRRNLRGGARRR
jgi:hypothetical protein